MAAKLGSHCPMAREVLSEGADFDMFASAYQENPAEALRFAREENPVFYSEPMGYWIVSRYEDVKAVFRDPITYSAYNALERLTPVTPEAAAILRSYDYAMDRTLVNEVEPIHMERRRLLIDAFEPAKLEKHRASVVRLVEDKVDAFAAKGRVDLVAELLWEVPLSVALHFLGVPDEDRATLRQFAVAHTVNIWGRPTLAQQEGVAHGVGQFWRFSGEVLQKMKDDPDGVGWMYDMIAMHRRNPEIVTDNFLHSMMMAIIVAAHETTSLAAANAFKTLLSRRPLWEAICARPELIPSAVEECLRHSGSVVAWRRQTTRAVELAGVRIPEGAKLFLATASANRDPSRFENPDEVDLFRDNSAEHLTFGYGAHQCMGKNIGRMEICVFLETLSRRLPDLRLCEQSFSYLPNTSFRGPESVWVEWDPTVRGEGSEPARFPIGAPDQKALARDLVVAKVRTVARGTIAVRLRPKDGETLPGWTAGAHVELELPTGERRKYSLCGERAEGDWHIAVQREEKGRGGSAWLHDHLREGAVLPVRGPKNFFRLEEKASFHLLVAGGIGITPILAMADVLRARGRPYRLVYLGREADRLAFRDRVESHGANASIHLSGRDGRIDLAGLVSDLPAGSHVYACGSQPLLDDLAQACDGREDVRLTVERFRSVVATQLDPAGETRFEVHLSDSGLDLAVGPDQTLLDTLLTAGIDVPHDCLEGLCGSCEVAVMDGEIDHRDSVLTEAERRSSKRMMACCSRGKGPITLAL